MPADRREIDLRRVSVVGTSCAGKTTLAHRLAGILAVPHIELDAIHWGPNWSASPPEKFRAQVAPRIAADCWVIDGNYSAVQDLILARATTVIWLNYSFRTVFARAWQRTLRRVVHQEEIFAGNRETFRSQFLSRDSILWWVITTYRRRRRQFRQLFAGTTYPQLALVELRNPDAAEAWLANLDCGSTTGAAGSGNRSTTTV